MKRENASQGIATEKPSGEVSIDFHSPEFNRTDDLNDFSGNCCTFETLDGIITADMRHQMERRRCGAPVDSAGDEAAPREKTERGGDAPESIEALPPLTVISEGRTLIVDTDAERALACGRILTGRQLTCTLLITQKTPADRSIPRLSRLAFREVDAVSITGAFGGFSALVTTEGRPGAEAAAFDLILDLQTALSYAGDRLPMGYYAPGPSAAALDEAMAELPEMRGRFKKPQFTFFQKTRCLHGRSRNRDCRHCLDVCPFGAIQSADRKLSVNQYLCQGCGGCALVCPADAIRMVHSPQDELLNRVRQGLASRADAGTPPALVITDAEADVAGGNNGHRVDCRVEEIAGVGLDMILAALAYGAGEVLVACGRQNPPGIRKAVAWQTRMAKDILKGLDLGEDRVRFAVVPPEQNAEEEEFKMGEPGVRVRLSPPPAAFPPGQDKRALARLAAQHLYNESGVRQPRLPLPDGSPFGAVAVAAACTLCMACAAACPSGALSAGGDVLRLVFRESRCHQCGLCEEACPEGAIQLLPRLLCDPEAVEAPAVLREAEPFRCVECGVPFASPALIDRIQEKLTGHWMYASERQRRRLRMCPTCRTRDALLSQEMTSWNR